MKSGEETFAVCVGHGRPGDCGALACDGITTERHYNTVLGMKVVELLGDRGIPAVLIARYEGAGYVRAMRWLKQKLDAIHAAGAVELHFNAADSAGAHGHEWLHWRGSEKGRALALVLDKRMRLAFPSVAARGLKEISYGGRGAGLLGGITPPAVICEPFFGSNRDDFALMEQEWTSLAGVIAGGIETWWKEAVR